MSEEFRGDRLMQLVQARFGQGEEPDDATDLERQVVLAASQGVARELQDLGVLPRPRTADDLTMRQLTALAAVWDTVRTCDLSRQLDRRLGDVKKVIPAEQVKWIDTVLRWGVEEDDGGPGT